MPITPSTLEKLAHAAASAPEPIIVPWPMPGNVGGLVSFADYKAWQDFIIGFSLSPRVPELIARIFERAQKLYLLGWIDLDLVGAAELTALMSYWVEFVMEWQDLLEKHELQALHMREIIHGPEGDSVSNLLFFFFA
jgi:hypothetical protein